MKRLFCLILKSFSSAKRMFPWLPSANQLHNSWLQTSLVCLALSVKVCLSRSLKGGNLFFNSLWTVLSETLSSASIFLILRGFWFSWDLMIFVSLGVVMLHGQPDFALFSTLPVSLYHLTVKGLPNFSIFQYVENLCCAFLAKCSSITTDLFALQSISPDPCGSRDYNLAGISGRIYLPHKLFPTRHSISSAH